MTGEKATGGTGSEGGLRRDRFWVEVALGVVAAALAVGTLLWRDWIEALFGVEPDGASGALEWLLVVVPALVATGSAFAARSELRRRPRPAD